MAQALIFQHKRFSRSHRWCSHSVAAKATGREIILRLVYTLNEAIKQAVEAGLGLGIVSIHTLELELETKRLQILDVKGFPIRRHWYIMQRRGKRLSPATQEIKTFVLEHAKEFIQVHQ